MPPPVAGLKEWKRDAHHAASLFLFSLRLKQRLRYRSHPGNRHLELKFLVRNPNHHFDLG
jgi:hypothetical protein